MNYDAARVRRQERSFNGCRFVLPFFWSRRVHQKTKGAGLEKLRLNGVDFSPNSSEAPPYPVNRPRRAIFNEFWIFLKPIVSSVEFC